MDKHAEQVDTSWLKPKLDDDRRKDNRDHATLKMKAFASITRDGVEYDGATVSMPAADQPTKRMSVSDDLLARITPRDGDAKTIEIGLEDVLWEEIDAEHESDLGSTFERELGSGRIPDDTLEIDFTPHGTTRRRRELTFEAEIDDHGRLCTPRAKLEDGGVRPGMRFKVVATQILPED